MEIHVQRDFNISFLKVHQMFNGAHSCWISLGSECWGRERTSIVVFLGKHTREGACEYSWQELLHQNHLLFHNLTWLLTSLLLSWCRCACWADVHAEQMCTRVCETAIMLQWTNCVGAASVCTQRCFAREIQTFITAIETEMQSSDPDPRRRRFFIFSLSF